MSTMKQQRIYTWKSQLPMIFIGLMVVAVALFASPSSGLLQQHQFQKARVIHGASGRQTPPAPFYNPQQQSTTTRLYYDTETGNSSSDGSIETDVTTENFPEFTSPVLEKLAPLLLDWKQQYGHPNIPLKNPGGNQCLVLRRLHIQNKLSETEIDFLTNLGFVFHSMEDVYKYADFEDMFGRLVEYEAKANTSHNDSSNSTNNFQIPKKCPEDPELGAWVTGIRRLGKDGVNPDHERRLNSINFVWVSQRQCGSKFMIKYRELAGQIDATSLETVLSDPVTISWIQAQQEALKRNGLSQTRVHYMGNMFGDQWTTIGKENNSGVGP